MAPPGSSRVQALAAREVMASGTHGYYAIRAAIKLIAPGFYSERWPWSAPIVHGSTAADTEWPNLTSPTFGQGIEVVGRPGSGGT